MIESLGSHKGMGGKGQKLKEKGSELEKAALKGGALERKKAQCGEVAWAGLGAG